MKAELTSIARRSKTAIIAYKIYDNWRIKRQAVHGVVETGHGSTHKHRALADSLSYINVQFEDYLQLSGLALQDLQGKRVFELGFGDNIGVALRFLAAGAERVVCLDKFYSARNDGQERRIYQALRETLSEQEKFRFDEAVDLSQSIKFNPEKLKSIYGVDVEKSTELPEAEPFDLVVSRGAIQDIYDPDQAFNAMDRLLKPGGYALHKIDLSDQGMFRNQGMNPLTYLTIPEPVYRLMAIDSGKPNRKLKTYYQQKMIEQGYDARLLVTSVIGRGGKGDMHPHKEKIIKGVDYSQATLDYVTSIRPRLIQRYRHLPDEELIVDGIFVVARKQGNGGHENFSAK